MRFRQPHALSNKSSGGTVVLLRRSIYCTNHAGGQNIKLGGKREELGVTMCVQAHTINSYFLT